MALPHHRRWAELQGSQGSRLFVGDPFPSGSWGILHDFTNENGGCCRDIMDTGDVWQLI